MSAVSGVCRVKKWIAQIGLTAMLVMLQGCCTQQGYYILAATGTVIGVEVSQNPATQSPQAKLGYNRCELAFVPTNRSGTESATGSIGEGAKDSANVIMEIRYSGIFDTGPGSGIYQRLAVGNVAVLQPGASLMFMKDANGYLSPEAQTKAAEALRAIPGTSGNPPQKPNDKADDVLGSIPGK